jgi:hypothetical protein
MSVRTLEQLSDKLAEEIVWRKKELTAIRLMIESGSLSIDRRTALLRGGVALLYAHWEGFIKAASKLYLEFIHYQRLTYSQLSKNFIAVGIRNLLNKGNQSSKIRFHLDVVDFFSNRINQRSNLPYKDGVNTKSNLSSDVFKEIIETLGLDYSEFETKQMLIDELLLKNRNTIAHGEYLLITLDEYLELHNQILQIIERYRTQVENAAALKHYLAA